MRRLLASCLCLLAACAAEAPGSLTSPIINGSPTSSYREVVAVVTVTSGGSVRGICSGTVIGPRTVLTAKHCIDDGTRRTPPANLRVVVGTNIFSSVEATYQVTEVFAPPGPFVDDDLLMGNDIALVNVSANINTPIREVARSTARRGMPITIVGFGRTDPNRSGSGVKFMGTTNVGEIYLRVFQTMGMSRTCQGDSGGPAFDAAGRVIGITSFGIDERCREDMSFYTETAHHRELIAQALGGEPPCTPRATECNGADDDCDGRVDSGCGTLGADCFESSDCTSGQCRRIQDRMVCTQDCVPFSTAGATGTCPAGYYCDVTSCSLGACVPGSPGTAPDGASCTRDGDCASAHCQNLATGGAICGRPCRSDGDACGEGLTCNTQGLTCGVCVSDEGPMLPFGTPCGEDRDCASGNCEGMCTQACTTNADCPGFRCGPAGVCTFDPPGPHGALCEDGADCQAGLACATVDGDDVCTSACDAGCPVGTECDRGVCLPPGDVLGVPCEANTDCRSGICAGVCTRVCDERIGCPDGFECRPAGVVSGCFPAPAEPEPESGGRCSVGGSSEPLALGAFGLALLALARRRRQR
ncbi:MAG: S1 family peptidase [Myxococcales bacterium]|nr:S1 family peptidase [Myxococcales bacterium]